MLLKEKKDCCGCGACKEICPRQCITMIADEEGFLYPKIDEEKCLHCGLCESVCSNAKILPAGHPKAVSVVNKDETIRLQSSSGGVFSAIASYIIEKERGVVFGACYEEDLSVSHKWIDSVSHLHKLRGSKYVQSKIGDLYCKVAEFLKSNRKVFFTGTPCQVAGLKAYLKHKSISQDGLIVADIICHGVPSPLLWKKYLDYRQKKGNCIIKNVEFRNKSKGWRNYAVVFTNESGKVCYRKQSSDDLYMRLFLGNWSLRLSCYSCSQKSVARVSDLTLADFWGVDKVCSKEDDNRGTSLVLIHSEKGKEIIEKLQTVEIEEVDIEKAILYNKSAVVSSVYPSQRKEFFEDLKTQNFKNIEKRYCRRSKKDAIKGFLRRVKKFFKRG